LTDLPSVDLLLDKMTDSSPLQTQIIPKDILLDNGTMSLLKEKSTNTERNSSLESSLIQPTLGKLLCLESNIFKKPNPMYSKIKNYRS